LKIYILQKLFAVTSLQFSRTQIFEAQGYYYVRKRAQELSEATRTKENNNLLNHLWYILMGGTQWVWSLSLFSPFPLSFFVS
jgi:hypothetical protein